MSRQTSDESSVIPGRLTRRHALAGAAIAGLSLPLLSACGDDSPSNGLPPSGSPAEPSASNGVEVLGPVEDIPVGGGVIFTDSRVVVTQPEADDFRCFSAVCPHEGCLVAEVTSTIACKCHNSSFDISTGEVLGGPAPAPLSMVDFTINKKQVVLS